jgi:F0F1-type ATP synthase epsilon subunit
VQGNVLTLVCEAGEAAAEIDMARVKAAEAKAREKLAGLDKLSQEYINAEASLRKALARELLSRRTTGSGNLSS